MNISYGKGTTPIDFGCHGNKIGQLARHFALKLALSGHMACDHSTDGNFRWIIPILHMHVGKGQYTEPIDFQKY